ncbi:TetR/AcrR family transcriptional regulator [Kibdelosporangium phytohabitans]|uniref:TetR family transcriptional regulator n=1 Tax=Kibdelosporangium phytohabitans TaxID=860235 RepID=A0A0N9I9Y2_9PSEU|nr:TetR/AcrR family transcriptional regulator [Kibdelosporangium phytohabitans]ALG11490.1 TetR family transcriptional regulator [Kibdelosporangium phytohabitans]MBE1462840.1 AcrR family transcriptional regulator [Kibdelosporangium phytohabitans]
MDDLRTRMLEAAEQLLDSSPDRDISTRAVCEAVGVGAPALYRLFGDKNGLLSAVVDHGFERYLSIKRITRPSPDPVADVAAGWDNHIRFALEHPTVYRLMYSPSLSAVPKAAGEAFELLHGLLERCAEAGRLRIPPEQAAQTIMTASVGVALSLVTQPDTFTDKGLSERVRDAVFASVFADEPADSQAPTTVAAKALQLKAMLDATPGTELAEPEANLLKYWLERLATSK